MLLQEAVAIVISPKYNKYQKNKSFLSIFDLFFLSSSTEIYSLTPDVGIATLSSCTKTGFHEHINRPPLYIVSQFTYFSRIKYRFLVLHSNRLIRLTIQIFNVK